MERVDQSRLISKLVGKVIRSAELGPTRRTFFGVKWDKRRMYFGALLSAKRSHYEPQVTVGRRSFW